jgi:hypothetical protein
MVAFKFKMALASGPAHQNEDTIGINQSWAQDRQLPTSQAPTCLKSSTAQCVVERDTAENEKNKNDFVASR